MILRFLKRMLYSILILIGIIVLIILIVHFSTAASNNRNWNDDQSVLPYAEVNGNKIAIHNIRNFNYASTTSYTRAYYDKTFDLDKIVRVWYIVNPFSGIPGSAHTFLSFEFEGNEFVSISIEIRKEKGESFSPISGLFNQYELMYVIADERDVIKLRTNYRKDIVYAYPMKASREKVKLLFMDMVERTDKLKVAPEFYNSITNTCTTNIVNHVNKITPGRVPLFNLRILLPANSDKLAYDLGLIDTNLSFEDARKRYFVNDKAMKYADSSDFSVKMRQEE